MISDDLLRFLLGDHSAIDADYIRNMIYIHETLHHHREYHIVGNGFHYRITDGQISLSSRFPRWTYAAFPQG
jgi:hypothetical protein